MNLEEFPRIPVVWVVSRFKGRIENTFFVPNKRVDTILRMIMEGHEDIYEPFENLKYLGTFNEATSPF